LPPQILDGSARYAYIIAVKPAALIGLILLFSTAVFAADSDPATMGDLKQMLQHLDKRFEQIDKRFELIEKRFNDLKYYMTGVIAIATAILGYLILRVMRQEEKV